MTKCALTPYLALVPLSPEKQMPKLTVLGVAPLLGEAIKRIHRNESVSRLFV